LTNNSTREIPFTSAHFQRLYFFLIQVSPGIYNPGFPGNPLQRLILTPPGFCNNAKQPKSAYKTSKSGHSQAGRISFHQAPGAALLSDYISHSLGSGRLLTDSLIPGQGSPSHQLVYLFLLLSYLVLKFSVPVI